MGWPSFGIKSKTPETRVIRVCIAVIIILIGLVGISYFVAAYTEKKDFFVYFGNNEPLNSYRDEELTAVINNNNYVDSHKLSLYGLSSTSSIFASLFSDNDGDSISHQGITFSNGGQLQPQTGSPIETQVTINSMALGSYNGWFYIIDQNNYSLPINISTPPMIIQSILIIMIGAATAIAFLEIDKIVKKKHYGKTKNTLQIEIANAQANIANLAGIAKATEESKIAIKSQEAAVVDAKKRALDDRFSGRAGKARQAILNLASGLFAVIVGLLAFINNDYVISIVDLNFQEAIVLFGLGAGISSLKDLVARI
jgi:hypothetical protein